MFDASQLGEMVPMKIAAKLQSGILIFLVCIYCLVPATYSYAQTSINPLMPPNTQSPRDTLFGFINTLEEAYSHAQDKNGHASIISLDRAVKNLDLSQLPPDLAAYQGIEAALMLKEVFDRVQLPPHDEVPDITQVKRKEMGTKALTNYSWAIPGTAIKIGLISEGERAGEFLFTAHTVARIREYYERVRHLPYRDGATPGLYDAYLSTPGHGLEVVWSARFPDWSKRHFGDHTIWQLIGFGITAVIMVFLVILSIGLGKHFDSKRLSKSGTGPHTRWLPWTTVSICVALGVIKSANWFIADILNLIGVFHDGIIIVFGLVWYGLASWLAFLVTRQLGELIIVLRKMQPGAAMGQLVRLSSLLAGIGLMAAIIVYAGQDFGLPTYSIVTGLGVGGIAIGFGAQSLVRDIFSGVFFLLDDAFRVGEYVDIDGTTGTVDKISIRTLRLRHHLGALHVIPYGVITKLTNHSRDWVVVKQQFTVPFNADMEKIRKLFKKIGQQMYEDNPYYAENIIEPFKMQGVYKVDDIGIVVRTKFKAKPTTQFVIRKELYARIQKVFEENGLEFARKEVFVRIPGMEENTKLDPKQAQTIAGAAIEAAEPSNPKA
jgi:small-conductance mechanosensitive channel